MPITLYSTNCPKCKVLETKLTQMGLNFDVINDVETVTSIGKSEGILSAPILKIGEECLDFTHAIKYLKEIAK